MAERKSRGGGRTEQPLVTVKSALVSAGADNRGGVVHITDPETAAAFAERPTEEGALVWVEFGEPTLSKSGGSYLVSYGSFNLGALKVVGTAYIGLGKDKARHATVDDGVEDAPLYDARRRAAQRVR